MLDFILKYWIQELFTVIIGVIAWMGKRLIQKKNENDLLKEGMVAILHDRLYQLCSYFISRGYCTLEDRNNLEYLYKPYTALGGNGTGESLYKKCIDLPIEKEV